MEEILDEFDATEQRLKLDPSQSARVRYPPGCPVLVVKNTDCIFSGVVSECFISLSRGSMSDGLLQYEVLCTNWHGNTQTIVASNIQLAFALNCPVNVSPSYFSSARFKAQNIPLDQPPVRGVIKGVELAGETYLLEKMPTFIYMVESESVVASGEVTTCRHIGVDPEFLTFRPVQNGTGSSVPAIKGPLSTTPRSTKTRVSHRKIVEESNPQSSNNTSTSASSSSVGFDKCYELEAKVPCFQGDAEKFKNTTVPDYTFLMNFPRTVKYRRGTQEEGDMIKQCVMCGSTEKEEANESDIAKNGGVFIPNQNKGLCTFCDVKVWVVRSSGLQIKWCKGCKNFRPWAAFGEKGHATKCVRCRDRQREKYASQQKEYAEKGMKRKRVVEGSVEDSGSDQSS
jgi:hypothetical protein